jgi:hypothetical protein
MRQHLGIVSLKPIGGLVTNNPATTTQDQIDAAKRAEAVKQAEALRQSSKKSK